MCCSAPLEAWQAPLKEQVVVSLEVQVDDTILPKYGEGEEVLPWTGQVRSLNSVLPDYVYC